MNTRSAVVALMAGLVLLLGTGSALATPLTRAAVAAEQQFGGHVFAAELYREDGKRLVEVELLSGGQIVEAELLVAGNQNANGKRYIVDIRNQEGEFEVIVNSRDGRVMRIVRD